MYSVSPAPRRGERRARDATHTHTRLCAQGVIRLLGNATFSVVSNQDYDGNLVQHTIACRCQNSAHRQHTGTGWAMNRNDRLSGRRQLKWHRGGLHIGDCRLPPKLNVPAPLQRWLHRLCVLSVSPQPSPPPLPHPTPLPCTLNPQDYHSRSARSTRRCCPS